MKLNDLSALISVREFAVKVFDNVYFKMSPEEVKLMRNKINLMDRTILDGMIKLDLTMQEEGSKKKNENPK